MIENNTGPAPQFQAQIDKPAPDFEARSTQGVLRLSDFRGRWLIFFSHPADFTPVCASEFVAFQNMKAEFEKLNCSVLGLSVDSVYAHLAWIRDLRETFGVEIEFPIVEDISMSVARAYGMIHEASMTTAAVRALYFIDPDGVIRAITHYPMNVGRSVAEIFRVLQALQRVDENALATPEGWTPGERFVLPPPASAAEVANRKRLQDDSKNWYFTQSEGGKRGN